MKTDAHRLCWVCRARRIAAVLFFLSLIPALAHAREMQAEPPSATLLPVEPGGLTADEVARRAVETSPDLESKLREVEAAAAQVDAAVVGFFPKLKTQATYNHLSYVEPAKFGGGVQAPGAPVGPIAAGTQLVNATPTSSPPNPTPPRPPPPRPGARGAPRWPAGPGGGVGVGGGSTSEGAGPPPQGPDRREADVLRLASRQAPGRGRRARRGAGPAAPRGRP